MSHQMDPDCMHSFYLCLLAVSVLRKIVTLLIIATMEMSLSESSRCFVQGQIVCLLEYLNLLHLNQ